MLQTTRTLLEGIVDYAGLFPPAKLAMDKAVKNYAEYLAGPHAWMLGRFVVPVARLAEFEACAAPLFPAEPQNPADEPAPPWRISALIGEDADADIDAIFAFNQRHAPDNTDAGGDDEDGQSDDHPADADLAPAPAKLTGAVIDTIEIKAANGREIDRLMGIVPEQLEPYFEIPIAEDPRGMLAAMAGTGARAKIRTGGITLDAFPPAEHVARFLVACASADVPFKATAGLHHPVRAEQNLTYEPGCPRAVMYGFLNVFLAAAMVRIGEGREKDAVELLSETDPSAFRFVEQGVAWRDKRLPSPRLAMVRESFATSFGSCSFEEPVNDLKALSLVD